MSYVECELPEFYDYTEPVARKEHRCSECRAPILKGEKHFHGVGKWNGEFESHRQHLACMEACMLMRNEFNDGECIAFGDLKEAFEETRRECSESGRHQEPWKRLRSLMAQILWRERKARS